MVNSTWVVFAKAVALSFARAFVATAVPLTIGLLTSPNFSLTKASLIALVVASLAAGLRAVQALFTNAEPTDQHVN